MHTKFKNWLSLCIGLVAIQSYAGDRGATHNASAVIRYQDPVLLGHAHRVSSLPPLAEPFVSRLDSIEMAIQDAHTQGNPAATVTLIEYSDYQCVYCGVYHRRIYPEIKKRFIDRQKINYVFIHFPLEHHLTLSMQHALAGYCAGEQGQFWSLHHLLFRYAYDPQSYLKHISGLALDDRRFKQCLVDGKYAKIILSLKQQAKQMGIYSTPSFVLALKNPTGGVWAKQLIRGLPKTQDFLLHIQYFLHSSAQDKPR